MRKWVISLCFLSSACHVPSRMAMEGSGGRTSYNTAIQMTNSQQMLLNLVRLRHVDIPLFLDVSGVTTQFTYKTIVSPTFTIPGFDEENPVVIGGELSWQNQPTISYTPLEGKAFTSRLLTPIQLSTIQQLVYSGWEIDRLFLMLLQNLDELYNAPERAGTSRFKHFSEAAEIFQYFQARGELQVGVVACENKSLTGQILQIAVPDEDPKALRILDLIPDAKRGEGKVSILMKIGFNERGKLGVMPRTVLSCMYYLSQGVCGPDSHYMKVPDCNEEELQQVNTILTQLFHVYCSSFPPKSAYVAVQYRKNWYYIDWDDISSKKTFALLMQLYNLQAAEEPRSVGPILTLPLK